MYLFYAIVLFVSKKKIYLKQKNNPENKSKHESAFT